MIGRMLLQRVSGLITVVLLLSGCGAAPTDTFAPVPPAASPAAPLTPVSYSLCLFLTSAEDGRAVVGGTVALAVADGTYTSRQTSSKIGEVCWSHLPGATIDLVISKPGYDTKEETLTLDRGSNGVVIGLVAIAEPQVVSVPLVRAHAHNDYEHQVLLLDSLEHGFTSIEVDIHLVGAELFVAHDIDEVQPGRTLSSLYLDILRERITDYGGWVYFQGPQITLLIDIKTEAEPTYLALRSILEEYQDIVTVFGPSGVSEGPILVIISGNRPRELMRSESVRYAAYDGRMEDLGSADPASFIPLISARWTDLFNWEGIGPMPGQERKTLREIVERAHLEGRRVRFWATPDNPSTARDAVWLELLEADVDLINTDDLQGLQRFLIANNPALLGN